MRLREDIPAYFSCRSGKHIWADPKLAFKCCNGFVPIYVPLAFKDDPEAWAEEPIERLYDHTRWSRIFILDDDEELYRELWVRLPTFYQSSTGKDNPGLHIEN